MVKHKVYFRADGNSAIGLGHIYRSLSLMNMIKDDYQCILLTKKVPYSLKSEIDSKQYDVVEISIPKEIQELEYLKNNILTPKDIVVLDGYSFDTNYQIELKRMVQAVVCIDDLKKGHFVCDAIINHAPQIESSEYSKEKYTRFYSGLAYSLLRPKFLSISKLKREIKSIKTLLVCFGGSDFNNLTTRVLQILSRKIPDEIKQIEVVVGGANPYISEIKNAIELFKKLKVNVHVNLSEEEMANLMLNSDMAILPSSGILYEALAVKMPIISGFYVDNQEGVYNGFNNLDLIYGVGDINIFEDYYSLISDILERDPKEKIFTQSKYINGTSKENIKLIFSKLINKVSLRSASKADLDMYFEWANDTNVRANAIAKNRIEKKNHIKWFNSKLENENCFMYVIQADREPIGQIRFDVENSEAIIDYSVSANYRGKGYGKLLLMEGMNLLKNEAIPFTIFKAIVKKDNIASNTVFHKLGFEKIEEFVLNGEIFDTLKLYRI